MGTRPNLAVVVGLAVLMPNAANAAVFAVNDVTSLRTALTTAASNGQSDTINLADGVYSLVSQLSYDSAENFSLTLQAAPGASVTIDGGGGTRLLYLWARGANGHVTIRGIQFNDGYAYDETAAGVMIRTQQGNLTVEDSSFTNCWTGSLFFTANASGGYFRVENTGTLTLKNNYFADNRAKGAGGGAFVMVGSGATVRMINNVFVDNEAVTHGAGAYIYAVDSAVTLTNNTITGNWVSTATGYGGGGLHIRLYSDTASPSLSNNIIWGNTSADLLGEDVYFANDENGNGTAAPTSLRHNDLTDVDWAVAANQTVISNIDLDPMLSPDYHLNLGSPCIDAGWDSAPSLPTLDYEGDVRLQGPHPDIGADEYPFVDTDGDGIGDDSDNCPNDPNAQQEDGDQDGLGDVCDDCQDVDEDGFGGIAEDNTHCAGGPTDDCDDLDALVHPGANEVVNGIDDDCDAVVDEGTVAYDDDGDGWSENDGDCDDIDPDVRPGAMDVAHDGIDQDCDGFDNLD